MFDYIVNVESTTIKQRLQQVHCPAVTHFLVESMSVVTLRTAAVQPEGTLPHSSQPPCVHVTLLFRTLCMAWPPVHCNFISEAILKLKTTIGHA